MSIVELATPVASTANLRPMIEWFKGDIKPMLADWKGINIKYDKELCVA